MRKKGIPMRCCRVALTGVFVYALSIGGQTGFGSPGYAGGAAEYLHLPAYGAAAALGGAVGAWRAGITGFQFNPAVLEGAPKYYTAGGNTFREDDRTYVAFDGAMTAGLYYVVGISFISAGVSAIERRNEFGTLEGYFSDREQTAAASVAGRLRWDVAWGVRARYLHQRLDKEQAHGLGADFGATWQPDSNLCIGAGLLNCASRLWWSTGHADIVPLRARLAVNRAFFNRRLLVEGDFAQARKQPLDIQFGVQYSPLGVIDLRGGIFTSIRSGGSKRARDPQWSAGFGIHYAFCGFDYAVTIPRETIGVSHHVSIVLEYEQ